MTSRQDSKGTESASMVLGSVKEAEFPRLMVRTVADEVQECVRRAGYGAASPEHRDALRRLAQSQVEAAAAFPIDPAARTDAWALAYVDHLTNDKHEARVQVVKTSEARSQARRHLAALQPPLSLTKRWLCIVGAVALTLLTSAAVTYLLWPTVDMALVRDYLVRLAGVDAMESSVQALVVAALCAGALLFWQLAIALFSGQLLWRTQANLLVVDLLFALAFALARSGPRVTLRAASVSFFEFGLVWLCSVGLGVMSGWLREERARAEPYRRARTEFVLSEQEHAEALVALADAEQRLVVELQALEAREDAVRRLPAARALVEATVDAAYIASLSDLIKEQVASLEEEENALADFIREHQPLATREAGLRSIARRIA